MEVGSQRAVFGRDGGHPDGREVKSRRYDRRVLQLFDIIQETLQGSGRIILGILED